MRTRAATLRERSGCFGPCCPVSCGLCRRKSSSSTTRTRWRVSDRSQDVDWRIEWQGCRHLGATLSALRRSVRVPSNSAAIVRGQNVAPRRSGAPVPSGRTKRRIDCRSSALGDLPLDVLGEIREGDSQSGGVILSGDAVWDVVGSDVDAGPSSTAMISQVMIIVPANAGSSETKSTAWTTRTSGTMST